MSYLKKMLLPEEQIIYIATLHWVVFLPGLVIAFLSGLLGFFSYDIAESLLGNELARYVGRVLAGFALVFALAGMGLLIGATVRQASTELAITNRRLIAKYGFISRATFELMINRVTGVNFEQSILGRMLGYGTVLVHGTGGDISPFDVVSDPQTFQRTLMRVLEKVNPSRV